MNIYLISNESYRLIEEEILKIVKENNYEVFNLNKSSMKEVIEEASYFSLSDAPKYLVVTNTDVFSSDKTDDDITNLLLKYMANPNPSTILIFTTTKPLDMRKKITKEMKSSYQVISSPKMDKKTLNNFLTKYIKDREYTVDWETVSYIMNNSYNNIDIMLSEIDKIIMYYNFPCRIKQSDVEKIVGQELDSNNFHFVSAVIDKKLEDALRILNNLKIYKVDSTILVSLLAREYRLMFYVKKLFGKGVSFQDICSDLNLADWQVNKLYNNGLHYSESELQKNLEDLCDIDMNIKKGLWDKDIALYGFLLDACI